MKFVDEATIHVAAGKGGDGASSFRREKFAPLGGPDGGDGGQGGSIHLVVDGGLNTLADFRYSTQFRAAHGANGRGANCTGKSGEDLYIPVPLGTLVRDAATGETIGDLTRVGQTLLVAKGGAGGLGNTRFKSSTNRAPRRTVPGSVGESRDLKLELNVLADVGLLGLPNAGKSTFLRAVSQARPKVAEYPFTTLHPQLGVVRLEESRSFVIADIPGLIEGAAEGAGLGIQFLKHLARTRVLVHLIDIAPLDPAADTVGEIKSIVAELRKFDAGLARRERWLVFNKIDLLAAPEADKRCREVVKALKWTGPVFKVSGLTGAGCRELCGRLMDHLENRKIRRGKPASGKRRVKAAAASAPAASTTKRRKRKKVVEVRNGRRR